MGLFGGGPDYSGRLNTAIGEEGQMDAEAQANRRKSRNQFEDILGEGQGALEKSVSSAMSAAMPQFRNAMQGVQESEVQRGVGVGGLGTSYEGDLESAFQRNIANAAGSQALGLYGTRAGASSQMYGLDTEASMFGRNRYMNMLTGAANAQKRRSAGLFGSLGAIGGLALGGPVGAEVGGMAGSAIGSEF
jgi:hypothetical protein